MWRSMYDDCIILIKYLPLSLIRTRIFFTRILICNVKSKKPHSCEVDVIVHTFTLLVMKGAEKYVFLRLTMLCNM